MSDLDYLNFSTDLKRIALWLADGDEPLAEKFIEINKRKFGEDTNELGRRKISEWLNRISAFRERGWKSAEDALTLSILVKNRFAR